MHHTSNCSEHSHVPSKSLETRLPSLHGQLPEMFQLLSFFRLHSSKLPTHCIPSHPRTNLGADFHPVSNLSNSVPLSVRRS
jgi:hypothetical protein